MFLQSFLDSIEWYVSSFLWHNKHHAVLKTYVLRYAPNAFIFSFGKINAIYNQYLSPTIFEEVRSSSWKIFLFMATLFYCQNQFQRIAKADADIHLLLIEANISVCMLVVLLKYTSHRKA